MIGLSTGLIYPNFISGIESPTDVSDLIGWWDFTDNTDGNLSNSHSSASAPSDGEAINYMKNKAYHLQGNTTAAIGTSLYASTLSTTASNPTAPIFKASSSDTTNRPPNESASNPISSGYFNERSSSGISGTYLPWMRCRYTTISGESSPSSGYLGTVQSSSDVYENLSTSAISMAGHTVFTVERRVTDNLEDAAGLVWSMQGYDPQYPYSMTDAIFGRGIFYRCWLNHFNDYSREFDSPFSGFLNSTMYELFANHATTNAKYRQWMPHNPDVDASTQITNDNKFAIWTTIVNGESATTTSSPYLRGGRMYRNTDTTKGIDADTYTSIAHTYDDTQGTPGGHDYSSGYKNSKLNLGLSDNTPSVSQLTPLEFCLGRHVRLNMTSMISTDLGNFPLPQAVDTLNTDDDASDLRYARGTAIYEILFYNKVLNAEEITGVENYLKNKYGDPEDLY